MRTARINNLLLTLAVIALAAVLVAPAGAKMVSRKIDRNVCLTTGGGRFVAIPGFPGERIDRRLLPDLRYLERRYKIFVTDALSEDPVHAANGEHPIGLAADIVPDTAAGGTWRDITALAHFAEPTQDHPIPPFRWVGYNGDAGHGRGNHLHLSWNHSETRPGVPAESVYTMRCPGSHMRRGGAKSGGTRADGRDGDGQHHDSSPTGGVKAGSGGTSGGIGAGRIETLFDRQAADPVVETGGVGL